MNHISKQREIEFLFLKSALTLNNPFNSTEDILNWVKKRNDQVNVSIKRIAFDEMNNWSLDRQNGSVVHSSNKFFSIQGLEINTNYGQRKFWDQPIINQPEIGYLGFITKVYNGILYFLIQTKIEPGNVNYVQLSPTIQATKSNYTKVHGGKTPNYLDYFVNATSEEILVDQLQSEQGARFFKKRNRNIIIKVNKDIKPLEDFRWLTLGQIKFLMGKDNIINMDTRTVISGISFGDYSAKTIDFYNIMNGDKSSIGYKMLRSALVQDKSLFSFNQIIYWLTAKKVKYDLSINKKSIMNLKHWKVTDRVIEHIDNRFFRVIGVNVEIGNREVSSWDQPLIEPCDKGICAFIIKDIDGIIHFLVQAKLEAGNFDVLELAPTVQCSSAYSKNSKEKERIPFLDIVLNKSNKVIFDTYQSEEGGRFYREQNRNIIVEVGDTFSNEVPENFTWLTLNQLKKFIVFNNYVNIQARSLISAITYLN
ncbi:MAG: NDP-hexose 2,3-dehydratase family protein [Cellulophaga sp.]|uniref:NDP-hexose 2,3-dehydratase family protein n=1 Tax=unclassified Cellulophaga TaxID=2634405 RepID=UPI0026E2AAF0|nr:MULTISPECIES: NDP-hexose 2,3-dehydratase family protein [unclassified Cellulophaga]MDO6489756.1 NDP-hexose 2,3-dehydratase family protein [Cellulophaga sp. 2_MG-2023]MDO6495050.1 NDP-hexose 2,3-dehydratase family protein [Cellulophaga sp. 3_MG-2023]